MILIYVNGAEIAPILMNYADQTSTPFLLKAITSIGQLHTHFAQLVQRSSIIFISASFSSIASSGQTPTQHPQKSHLFGSISIINIPVLA
jgi:hypothetical protein